jgi:hypothetical protein
VQPTGASLTLTGGQPTITVASAAVAYDAAGAGSNTNTVSTSMSWTHTATAGATVIIDIFNTGNITTTSVTYGGSACTLHATEEANNTSSNGRLYRYVITGVPGGAQTISVTKGSARSAGYSISFTNVGTVQTGVAAFGQLGGFGGAFSNSVTGVQAGEYLIHAFGGRHGSVGGNATSPTGGTNEVLYNFTSTFLQVSTAQADTTFGLSIPFAGQWAAIATRLSP